MDRTKVATDQKEKNQEERQEKNRLGQGNLQVNTSDVKELFKAVLLLFLKIVVLTLQAFVALLDFLLKLLRSYNPPPVQRQGGNVERGKESPRQSWLDDWPRVRRDVYELPKIDLGLNSGGGGMHPFVRDFVDPPRKSSRRGRKDLPKWLR